MRSIIPRLCRAGVLILLVFTISILSLRLFSPPVTSFMLQRMVTARWGGEKNFTMFHNWVSWENITPSIPLAVVASEDQEYPVHRGFDIESIADAWSLRQRGQLRGASTISWQITKDLFLWSGRSFVRKGVEATLTVILEVCLSKRRIL